MVSDVVRLLEPFPVERPGQSRRGSWAGRRLGLVMSAATLRLEETNLTAWGNEVPECAPEVRRV